MNELIANELTKPVKLSCLLLTKSLGCIIAFSNETQWEMFSLGIASVQGYWI